MEMIFAEMSCRSKFQSRRFRFKINVEIVVYIVDVIACSFVRSDRAMAAVAMVAMLLVIYFCIISKIS